MFEFEFRKAKPKPEKTQKSLATIPNVCGRVNKVVMIKSDERDDQLDKEKPSVLYQVRAGRQSEAFVRSLLSWSAGLRCQCVLQSVETMPHVVCLQLSASRCGSGARGGMVHCVLSA